MSDIQSDKFYPLDVSNPPNGWIAVYVKDIAKEIRPGFASGKHNSSGEGVPHIRPMNIDRRGRLNLEEVKFVSGETILRLACGDILFNNTNSPALIGKTTAITQNDNLAFSNHMTRLRLSSGHDFRFIAHQLHYLWSRGYFRNRCVNHVNQASISKKALANTVPLLLPPYSEQQRIVAKIEELFSNLDSGVAALESVQANLQRYRASMLKAAVEGRLTKQWRSDNPDVEPADQLLERILRERREKWEQDQLAKYEAKGKKPPKNWRDKYKEPIAPDTNKLPELPSGWCWASVNQLFINHDGARIPLKKADRDLREGTYPYYGASGIIDYIDNYIFDGEYLLVAEDGHNLVARKTPIAFKASGKFWVNNHAHILKCLADMPISYPEIAFNAMNISFYVTGTAQPKLPQAALNRIPIPLPPLAEQKAIVDEVERLVGAADSVSYATKHTILRGNRLRHSILKRAFEGKLVENESLSTHCSDHATDSAKYKDIPGNDYTLLHGN